MEVKAITMNMASRFVYKWHYAKNMPRINQAAYGLLVNDNLMGVMTFGLGTRPLHTIKRIFPTLKVQDYYELGRLCCHPEMPKNTESWFISRVLKQVKDKAIIFSWADGILGKPGYVYQASNFYYGGFIWSEMYIDQNGCRIHPRTFQGMSTGEYVGKFRTRSRKQTESQGLIKVFGKQFRYVYPLCSKREWKNLLESSTFTWERKDYPKDADCEWMDADREPCEKPIITASGIPLSMPLFERG